MRINTSSLHPKTQYPVIKHIITGLILAGGRGSRMRGQDKGLVDFEGRPMIEQVLDATRPQCARIIISCNRNIERYSGYGHDLVTDTLYPYAGPLSGVLEAMTLITSESSIKESPIKKSPSEDPSTERPSKKETPTTAQSNWLALLPVDAPKLPDKHIFWLHNNLYEILHNQQSLKLPINQQQERLPQAILPEDQQGLQPLFSLISTESLPSLRSYLSQGDRSVKRWITSLPHLKVQVPEQWGSFVNFNRHEDLLEMR